MQLITKLITPARSVPKFPILSKDGSFSSLLFFSLLLTFLRHFVIQIPFFPVVSQKRRKKKKRIRRIETLENLLDLTLFPITCPDFLLASTFSPFFYLSFLPTILPRRRVSREKDDWWEENFFRISHKNFVTKVSNIYIYICIYPDPEKDPEWSHDRAFLRIEMAQRYPR